MLKRPNGESSDTIPLTQFFHEWVYALNEKSEKGKGAKVADASRGKPSFAKDKVAYDAIVNFHKNAELVYPYGKNSLGENKFKEMAAEGFERQYGCKFDRDEMIFTTGGQFGIASCFYAVQHLMPDSYVVAPCPWYLNHGDIAGMFSGGHFSAYPKDPKFLPVNMLETGGRLDADALLAVIKKAEKEKKKIGGFIFCNPANPLGLVTRKAEWKKIVPVLEQAKDALIIMDEAFAEIVFDKNFEISILHASKKIKERTVIMRSGTKALGFPGERLAVMSVPKKLVHIFSAFQSRLVGNTPLSVQAGMAAVTQSMSEEKKGKISDYYFGNYKYLSGELAKKTLIKKVFEVEGGFYSLYDFSVLKGEKIPAFAKKILGNKKDKISTDIEAAISLMVGLNGKIDVSVATIPASSFGIDPKKMLLRISHSPSKKDLQEIVNGFSQAFG